MYDLRLYQAILRTDFFAFLSKCFDYLHDGKPFQKNWHHEAIAHKLCQVHRGEILRLVINIQPRALKSFITSVAWPAYLLGRDPSLNLICVSYSQDLANKLSRDFLKIVQADWYKRLFRSGAPRKETEAEFETASNGGRLATSVSGTITGRGADYIIIDDPLNATEAYSKVSRDKVIECYTDTLLSRLNSRTGAIVLIAQRLHLHDLSGFLLKQPGVEHLKLPVIAPQDMNVPLLDGRKHNWTKGTALHPARQSLADLDSLKRQIGSDAFSAQYLQEPIPPAGNMIKKSWLRFEAAPVVAQPGDLIVQSWDTANKATETSAYSVCLTFRVRNNNEFYLIDLYRDRPEFPELAKFAASHAQRFQAHEIIIEDKGSGTQLIQTLKRTGLHGVIAVKPTQDKITRMQGQTVKLEAGSLRLPLSAPWLDDFIIEIVTFPSSEHSDQVDALSQFLERRGNCENSYLHCDWGDDEPAIPSADYLLRFGRW